ncbi:hypothetical protein F5Y14DRAFT_409130 [Nemania sp. NC0429]|nr:hypothetical protein F5Y14DRAFT_409130 [Nemania sp. NC0429]
MEPIALSSEQAWYQSRRPAHKTEEPSQPWTTARCHRLLRPLVSRIASLRREIAATTSQVKPSTPRPASEPVAAPFAKRSGHHEEPDADSSLMSRKKRPRLTYSQRRGTRATQSQHTSLDQSQSGQGNQGEDTSLPQETKAGVKKPFKSVQPEGQHKTTSPGEIIAATPILRRARGKIVVSPVAPVFGLDLASNEARLGRGHRIKTTSSTQKRLDEHLTSLRKGLFSEFADFEGIYRSLEALLRATATTSGHGKSGPRSFLDICLRKVPQYIAELDAWEKFDAEQSGTVSTLDGIDTSAHIYNELESMGTNVGWRHLRVVVRADGVNAVKQAIEEGLFCDEFSQLLIDLCVQLEAASEAEGLVAALVDRNYPKPISTESSFTETTALQPLGILNSFTNQTRRISFLFRQYTMLLSRGSLPVDWLATLGFERVWSLAFQELAKTRPSYDAICFITQCISLLSCQKKRALSCGADAIQPDQDMAKASQRRLMSALAILASMGLLGETELKAPWLSDSDTQRITIIGDKIRYVIRACINGLEGYTRSRGNQILDFPLLALFFASGHAQGERIGYRLGRSIGKLLSSTTASQPSKNIHLRNHHDNIAWLIASIARACGRGTSVLSHQFLDILFRRLESLEIGQSPLDKLKAAAAFSIAQQTNNVRDLIYAERLHPPDQAGSGATSQQQNSSTLFTGYRWEETIGEWVTASPVVNRRRTLSTNRRSRTPILVKDARSDVVTSANTSIDIAIDFEVDSTTRPSQETDASERSTEERAHNIGNGQRMMMLKKRPRRIRSIEALTTSATQVLVSQQSIAISATPGLQKEHVVPDKENRVRLLAKKPRRSSGRIVLSARSQSRESIGQRSEDGRDGVLSDDELCI